MTKPLTTTDEYIESFSVDIQIILQKVRQVIKDTSSEAIETFSYGIPTFDLNGKHLVHFAAFKKHIGFYPTPASIETFKEELSQFKWAKGSVQFPLNKPIPYDLIKKIVLFRIKEVQK